jgi:N-acyl-phosphatidylethanolamine-hydrolysing phospholipase D
MDFLMPLTKITSRIRNYTSMGTASKPSNRTSSPASNNHPAMDSLSLREMVRLKAHHGSNGFVNPFTNGHGNFFEVLSWKLLRCNEFKHLYANETRRDVVVDWASLTEHNGTAITFIKHSTILIKDRDRYILVDPIFNSISKFIPDFSPLGFDPAEMPRPDHVLITHGHYDHLDMPSLSILPQDTHVITPLGYDDVFNGTNFPRTQLDWFDSLDDNGLRITLLPCNHWTMRNPVLGPNRALWGAYLVETQSGPTIFISGDSAYFNRYSELGLEFKPDLAIFSLGAYEPRWFMKKSHMNPEEVVRSFRELGAGKLMITHWGTFRLGDEPAYAPPLDLHRVMEQEGLLDRLVHVEHGQTVFFQGKSVGRVS